MSKTKFINILVKISKENPPKYIEFDTHERFRFNNETYDYELVNDNLSIIRDERGETIPLDYDFMVRCNLNKKVEYWGSDLGGRLKRKGEENDIK
jgi:hypothetical protein